MANNIYLIGNKNDFKNYIDNQDDISTLPVKNLPAAYFPFFYSSSESSIEKMKRLFPLFEGEYMKGQKTSQHNIDTEKLFTLLSILEDDYQPYNNNNVFHITIFIIICFISVSMVILKFINYFFPDTYIYIISGAIVLLLILSLMWAFVITGNGI